MEIKKETRIQKIQQTQLNNEKIKKIKKQLEFLREFMNNQILLCKKGNL